MNEHRRGNLLAAQASSDSESRHHVSDR